MFYRFLKITIGSAVRIFFRRIHLQNFQNVPTDKPLLIVSNHPSAFMDPLVVGVLLKNPVNFLARADVFTSKFIKWITKKAHVSPIYRIVDGIDSLEKNDAVFVECYRLLSEKKTILLFGEGFTDEIFVRRVKSLKKGPLRISLGAENKFDFKLGVNIVCVGLNYSDPEKFRSNILISFSKPIEVKKYKELFYEHNNRAMMALNKEIFEKLKNEVIHIEDSSLDELFEQLLIISGKGMNNLSYDRNISLEKRWKYSKKLSEAVNKKNIDDKNYIELLKQKNFSYFKLLENFNLSDAVVGDYFENKEMNTVKDFIMLIYCFPLFLFGLIMNFIPYKLPILVSHSLSKRPVFYSSINMAVSVITFPLCYFFTLFFIQHYSENWMVTISIGTLMPFAGLFAFDYFGECANFIEKLRFKKFLREKKSEANSLLKMRGEIFSEINNLIK